MIKRPGVDNFLKKMGEIYEIVVFTASLSKVSGIISFETASVSSISSMRTLCLTSWISTTSYRIGCLERVVIIIKETT